MSENLLQQALEPSPLEAAVTEEPSALELATSGADDPTAGRTIVGNAEPEGATVVVGGREVVVGGWAPYEVARREAMARVNPRSRSARLAARYSGRSYVGGQEALDSIVTARVRRDGDESQPIDPLEAACERYACALEEVLDSGPSSTGGSGSSPGLVVGGGPLPDDIRALADETDVNALSTAAEDAAIFADATGAVIADPPAPPLLPPLTTREVSVKGASPDRVESQLADLERAVTGRAEAVEVYRGRVAATFDAAARELEMRARR